jgi:hypothetical protein
MNADFGITDRRYSHFKILELNSTIVSADGFGV